MKKQTGEKRRRRAADCYHEARKNAFRHGLRLERFSDVHYALICELHNWRWEIYPGKHRIYVQKKFNKSPFLGVHREKWTLINVVGRAIQVKNRRERKRREQVS